MRMKETKGRGQKRKTENREREEKKEKGKKKKGEGKKGKKKVPPMSISLSGGPCINFVWFDFTLILNVIMF